MILLTVWLMALGYVLVYHGIRNFQQPGSLQFITALTGKAA